MADDHHAALLAIVDGEREALTPEQAKAIKAEIWDLRQKNGTLQARAHSLAEQVKALHGECDKLVAQVVAEEQRAVRAEIEKAEAVQLVRDGVDEIANPKRWRLRAGRWLGAR